ncbi:HNHc domain-containing protein [Trichophyton interdigitale]|nr:HNHc domain-containing protein [Trichophyton interdigitale]KAG5218036.1 HNHc domain-containing protein [Trichophyton interdigitale]KAG8206807.1 HNHc domain-containing protein [Trichophyton interdigitale]
MPHSLMSRSRDEQEIGEAKKLAVAILDMFDPGIIYEIEDDKIDRPTNALSMTPDIYYLFGNFDLLSSLWTQTILHTPIG